MQLFNTLSRKTEPLEPLQKGVVTLYTCGPTVYNYYHIGNLRNAVFNDTLRRALTLAGYDVKHVMNITDVGHLVSDADEGEDKLEKGAAREGKTVWEVADHYTEAFKHDMAAMNVLAPNAYHSAKYGDTYARATEFIDQQQDMVRRLLESGLAYQTKQAIYFDVTRLPDYGVLTGQRLTDKEVGARSEVVADPDKRSPYDFAVWFFTVGHFGDHTMRWPSPWGEGFPGWHLECSAIIHATLGDPIDIHTGGVDHIGTHHPNEMAQTEGAFGHELARTWVHNEFILVDGQKMSKSKGNAYTLKELTDRQFDPLAYRLLVLGAHYRTELNFTFESLQAAQNTLYNLHAWADLIHQPGQLPQLDAAAVRRLEEEVKVALTADLDTPRALAQLHEMAAHGAPTASLLGYLDRALGLRLAHRPDITSAQKRLVADREAARQAKDWKAADELRGQLAAAGLDVDDNPQGPRWRRRVN
jgi:cysteinyl-tRNA synthetase